MSLRSKLKEKIGLFFKERKLKIPITLALSLLLLLTVPSSEQNQSDLDLNIFSQPIIAAINDPDSFQAFSNEVEEEMPEFTTNSPKATNNIEPNDPLYGEQWYLSATNWIDLYKLLAQTPLELEKNSEPIIIVIIDSGVNSHEDLLPGVIFINPGEIPNNGVDDDHNGYVDDYRGCNMMTETCADTTDDSYVQHGTGVAGIIAAATDNNTGIAGNLGNPIKILPIKVIQPNGITNYSDIYEAFQYLLDLIDQGYKISVVNMSFAGFPISNVPADELIKKLYDKGVVLVAGSGNSESEHPNEIGWPANNTYVISVGGSYIDGCHQPGANQSSQLDVSAPYSSIMAPNGVENYHKLSGTSFSSPQAASLASILSSINPNLTPEEIKDVIKRTANKNPDCPDGVGAGVINFNKAAQEKLYPYEAFLPLVVR